MNRFMPACTFAVACVFAVSVGAQDAKVKSKTKIDADDAHIVTMTGCLQQTAGDLFVLSNATTIKGGDELKSKSKTKIDRDENETEVKEQSKTEIEHDDKPVGTAGAGVYELMPKEGVDLTTHVGHKVEITAIALDPAKGDADAKVKIETDTKVDAEDAPDAKMKSRTSMELPRGANTRLTVVSVKQIAPSCTM